VSDAGTRRVVLRVAVALTILGGVAVAPTRSEDRALVPIDLYVGFTRSSFLGVNQADAKAAFKVFATRMGEKRGYQMTMHVRIFEDLSALATEIERGTQGIVILDAWDYLTVSPGTRMPIEFVTVEQGVVMEEYLLLARSDSEIAVPADLEGMHVIVLNSTNATTGKHWLRTELLAIGTSDPPAFLRRLEIKQKVSQVVLPVFFGRADACVVDRSAFNIMVEMNPQVGKMLKTVHQSEPYLDTVTCVRRDGWEAEHHRGDLMAALVELTQDPAGEQITALFRFDALAPFEDRHLDTVRALRRRHDALEASLAPRAGGVGAP